jgi:putative protease
VELLCPAGSLPALKAAVDHGADWVYLGLRGDTNARKFDTHQRSAAPVRRIAA